MTAKSEIPAAEGKTELMQDRPVFTPEADIYETKEAIHLALNVPGVEEKDIDVSLEDDELSITAPQAAKEREGLRQLRSGYRTGVYKRAFTIVADIDKAKVKAKLSNGVLRLSLPKSEKAKPKRIEIAVG